MWGDKIIDAKQLKIDNLIRKKHMNPNCLPKTQDNAKLIMQYIVCSLPSIKYEIP